MRKHVLTVAALAFLAGCGSCGLSWKPGPWHGDDCGAFGCGGTGGSGGSGGSGGAACGGTTCGGQGGVAGSGGDPGSCYACACAHMSGSDPAGCADSCDNTISGSINPNFCNGTSALSQCAQCIADRCGMNWQDCTD